MLTTTVSARRKGVGEYHSNNSIQVENRGTIDLYCNDCIASIRAGSAATALMCSDAPFRGRCETFTADAPRLSEHFVGNNSVSSIRVVGRADPPTESPSNPNSDEIVLFTDAAFQGSCAVLGPGRIWSSMSPTVLKTQQLRLAFGEDRRPSTWLI